MRKLAFVSALITILTASACVTATTTPIPTTAITPDYAQEAADDVVFGPGGFAYRANSHQQGVINPWVPIESVEVIFEHNNNNTYVKYRNFIVTEAGESRNNIVIVRTPWKMDIGEVNLSITNENAGIEVIQNDWWSGPATRNVVLIITISPDIQPGEYTFGIGVNIEGVDHGVLPCTINVLQGTFSSFLELSAHQVTLEEASSIIGLAVPVPTYLPVNYEIREIYAYWNEIIFLISDREIEKELVEHTDAAGSRQRYEFQCRMRMTVSWIDGGFYIPPDKVPGIVVDIDAEFSKLIPGSDNNSLWVYFKRNPDDVGVFKVVISANKVIPGEELIKIAESFISS